MTWHLGPMAPFDLETTGTDVYEARIVTACVGRVDGSSGARTTRNWLINPGVPIPAEAAAIHGITDAHIADGAQPGPAVDAIAVELVSAMLDGIPVVGWNLSYDLSLLAAELRRHGLPSLQQRLNRPVGPVVDGLVIDKHVDKYRRGSRKLIDVARHYGIDLAAEDAHGAEADALASARVIWRIVNQHPAILQVPLVDLHRAQIQWADEQAASFRAYRQGRGEPWEDIDGTWPVKPERTAVPA